MWWLIWQTRVQPTFDLVHSDTNKSNTKAYKLDWHIAKHLHVHPAALFLGNIYNCDLSTISFRSLLFQSPLLHRHYRVLTLLNNSVGQCHSAFHNLSQLSSNVANKWPYFIWWSAFVGHIISIIFANCGTSGQHFERALGLTKNKEIVMN